MGNSPSHPLHKALKALLKSRGLKLRDKTIQDFLEQIDRVAPWFAVSGNLSLASWDKLGKDVERAEEQATVSGGIRPLCRLIRACLEERCFRKIVQEGQAALDSVKEERSTSSKAASEEDSESEGENDSEEELEAICKQMKDLELNKEEVSPSPYNPSAPSAGEGASFSCQMWREAGTFLASQAFPVFQPQGGGNRYHEPLDFKTVKHLAESVRTYGSSAAFTVAIIESLHRFAMTPGDWQNLVRATLNPGQYLDWKAYYIEYATEQAARNRAAGNPAWDIDMLMGQGRFANQQLGYPQQVYEQINRLATQAWKALPNKGEISGNLTKITQGLTEPFSDFMARLVEAAGRIFGDPDAAMPLIKQLVYEQCTKECRQAITPYKHKGLEVWMKVCRELGGPLTNSGLAAAIMQASGQQNQNSTRNGNCFSCGATGHLKRDCPKRRMPQPHPSCPPEYCR